MKSLIAALVFGLASIDTNGQTSNIDTTAWDKINNDTNNACSEKRISGTKENSIRQNKINFRAAQDFKTRFPHIPDVRWEVVRDDFIAYFVSNPLLKTIYYDKNGNSFFSINQYKEIELPEGLSSSVKSAYPGYTVAFIDEITTIENDIQIVYLVHLTNLINTKTVRVCNGEMKEIVL